MTEKKSKEKAEEKEGAVAPMAKMAKKSASKGRGAAIGKSKAAPKAEAAKVEEEVEAGAAPIVALDMKVAGEELAEVEEVADERLIKKTIKSGEKEMFEEERSLLDWKPRTELGRRVHAGEITSISDIIRRSVPIKEVEIVDKLLPGLDEEIISVGRVQRTTDSGRRMRFRVVAVVGNHNGIVGVGVAKGKEAGPTIRKAIDRAKVDVMEIKRGCGSWECGCGNAHTVPFMVEGKSGSVEVVLKPAPRGVGLVSGEVAKNILSLAGISDVWVTTRGHSRTGVNFAQAVFNALVNTNRVRTKQQDVDVLKVVSGEVSPGKPESTQADGGQ